MPSTQPSYTITNAQGNVVKQGNLSFSTATMIEGLLTTQGDDQYTLQLNRFNEGDFEYIPQLETQYFTIAENQTTRINVSYTQHSVQPQQMRFNVSGLPQGLTSTLTLSHSQGESNARTLEINHNGAYTLEIPQDGKAWQITASSTKGYKAVVTPSNFIADAKTTSIAVKYEEVQQAQERLMPFKDMTFNMIWNTTPIHSNIQEIADKSGNYSYVMAFVTQNVWSQTCFPAWGGAPSLALYDGLYAQDTQYLQSKGGSVAVSFGGENGASVESACSVDEIKNAYQYVLNTYKPAFIDFDIEGGAVGDKDANTKRFEAIKQMQKAGIDLKVSLTLPANIAGFPPQVLDLIKEAKSIGVDLYEINAMTMAWYTQKLKNRPIADSVMAAADVITKQLQAIYPEKSQQEIHAMLRVTPKIGIDYDMSVFYPSDAQSLSQYVMANGLAGVGFWSADIDRNKNINGNCGVKSADPDCSGVDQRPYEFTQTFAKNLNLN